MTQTLSDKQKKILALFKQGIALERKAQELYTSLLEHTDDAQIRVVVEFLLREEEAHEDKLREVYAGLRGEEP